MGRSYVLFAHKPMVSHVSSQVSGDGPIPYYPEVVLPLSGRVRIGVGSAIQRVFQFSRESKMMA